ncbi:sensor domain-containing diguanylate cyclase [Caldisericum exile]|uniref:sensor domain-containing diguanylate cyclase n=1 Tax=Caldisericum exile TaxID=693075 RepID=UPI003C72594D
MDHNLIGILKAIAELEESLTIEEALWKITNLAFIVFNAESATIIDVSQKPYHFVAFKNVDNIAASVLEKHLSEGSAGGNLEVIKDTQKPLIIPDTSKYGFWLKVGKYPLSWIGIPIILDNRVSYIVNIDSYSPNTYNEDFWEIALVFSELISSAVKKNKLVEEFFRTATLDKLTEVQTRQQLYHILNKNIDRYRRYGSRFSCLMLDLDKFKYINDTFGHEIGDKALVAFSKALKENLRQSDYIFRFGGDEFLIKLEEADGKEAFQIAKRLRETILSINIDGKINLSTSIGIKEYKGESLEDFLKSLDEALYQAKKTDTGIMITN